MSDDKSVVIAAIVGFIFGIVIGFVFGFETATTFARQQAIESGAGMYKVDDHGKVSFIFTSKPTEKTSP